MLVPQPSHCRPDAFVCLAESLASLNTTRGLLHCAVAVSMHEMNNADPQQVESQVRDMTVKIGGRIKSSHPSAIMAHAHNVLFDERGFRGNKADYHNPRNSYLPAVIRTGRGLPITLALVYKCVVEPLGVPVHGINAPGHFMVGIDSTDTDTEVRALTIIDPFNAGRMLSTDEALAVCKRALGASPLPEEPLAKATHKQWLVRIIQNLIAVFDRLGQPADMAAMIEMRDLVLNEAPAD